MAQNGHMCLTGLAELLPQSHPGTYFCRNNSDVHASIIPEGYVVVPKYEIYNLGNGLSYINPVA